MDEAGIKRLKLPELKKECEKRGLPKSGSKAELTSRLLEALKKDLSSNNETKESKSSAQPNVSGKRLNEGETKPLISIVNGKGLEDLSKEAQSGRHIKRAKTEPSQKEEEPEKDEEGEALEAFDKLREGPLEPGFDRMSKQDTGIHLANKNLDISNNTGNYYGLEYAKASVCVRGGKWYFETTIRTGRQIQIGWCTNNCDISNSLGDYWVFDGSKNQILGSKGAINMSRTYPDYWSSSDVITSALDVDAKTIAFWKNGKDISGGPVSIPLDLSNSNNNLLCPVVGLSRYSTCLANFGKTPLAYPQENFNMLYSQLTPKEIRQLSKLFIHYRDIGNRSMLEEKKSNNNTNNGSAEFDVKSTIYGNGFQQFQTDLGVTDDEDPTIWIISWKLRCKTAWEITRDEFMNGFIFCGCHSLEKIKTKVAEWRKQIRNSEQSYKQFYNFVFDYLKEDKTILSFEAAIIAWNIVLKDKYWSMFQDFTEFLRSTSKKAISRDAWQQLWHFMESYPSDLKDYDPNACWPLLYDEFVEWTEARNKNKLKSNPNNNNNNNNNNTSKTNK